MAMEQEFRLLKTEAPLFTGRMQGRLPVWHLRPGTRGRGKRYAVCAGASVPDGRSCCVTVWKGERYGTAAQKELDALPGR